MSPGSLLPSSAGRALTTALRGALGVPPAASAALAGLASTPMLDGLAAPGIQAQELPADEAGRPRPPGGFAPTPRGVRYDAGDGDQVSAWVILPSGATPRPWSS